MMGESIMERFSQSIRAKNSVAVDAPALIGPDHVRYPKHSEGDNMDKKAKKRLEVINKKLQTLRPRLAGSREQADDPQELKDLEDEIASLEAESVELKKS